MVEGVADHWLFAMPQCGPCELHGHGYWWEDRGNGVLHCVACWGQPPLRSLVKNVWQSCDGSELVWTGFREGDVVFFCRTDGVLHWPWPEIEQPDPVGW